MCVMKLADFHWPAKFVCEKLVVVARFFSSVCHWLNSVVMFSGSWTCNYSLCAIFFAWFHKTAASELV